MKKTLTSLTIILVITFFFSACFTISKYSAVITRIDEEDVEIRGTIPLTIEDRFNSEIEISHVKKASIEEATKSCARYDRTPELISYSVDEGDVGYFFISYTYYALYACEKIREKTEENEQ